MWQGDIFQGLIIPANTARMHQACDYDVPNNTNYDNFSTILVQTQIDGLVRD